MTDSEKLALERFRNILSYLQYENTAYWTRSGFLLAAEAALLGFVARMAPIKEADATWLAVTVAAGLCIVALILCVIGLTMLRNSIHWINRWVKLLQQIEPDAYGNDLDVFRGIDENATVCQGHFARDTAKYLIWVFIVAWTLLLVYLLSLKCFIHSA